MRRNCISMGATSGAGTAHPSGAPALWGSCYLIFSFICIICRSLFVLLYFFFQPLCCLFFFDIRIMIAPLVSSNSSLEEHSYKKQAICNDKKILQEYPFMKDYCSRNDGTFLTDSISPIRVTNSVDRALYVPTCQ